MISCLIIRLFVFVGLCLPVRLLAYLYFLAFLLAVSCFCCWLARLLDCLLGATSNTQLQRVPASSPLSHLPPSFPPSHSTIYMSSYVCAGYPRGRSARFYRATDPSYVGAWHQEASFNPCGAYSAVKCVSWCQSPFEKPLIVVGTMSGLVQVMGWPVCGGVVWCGWRGGVGWGRVGVRWPVCGGRVGLEWGGVGWGGVGMGWGGVGYGGGKWRSVGWGGVGWNGMGRGGAGWSMF